MNRPIGDPGCNDGLRIGSNDSQLAVEPIAGAVAAQSAPTRAPAPAAGTGPPNCVQFVSKPGVGPKSESPPPVTGALVKPELSSITQSELLFAGEGASTLTYSRGKRTIYRPQVPTRLALPQC